MSINIDFTEYETMESFVDKMNELKLMVLCMPKVNEYIGEDNDTFENHLYIEALEILGQAAAKFSQVYALIERSNHASK